MPCQTDRISAKFATRQLPASFTKTSRSGCITAIAFVCFRRCSRRSIMSSSIRRIRPHVHKQNTRGLTAHAAGTLSERRALGFACLRRWERRADGDVCAMVRQAVGVGLQRHGERLLCGVGGAPGAGLDYLAHVLLGRRSVALPQFTGDRPAVACRSDHGLPSARTKGVEWRRQAGHLQTSLSS